MSKFSDEFEKTFIDTTRIKELTEQLKKQKPKIKVIIRRRK